MLLFRSISLEVFLFFLIQQHSAQEDYGLDESEDHSDITEDGGEYHEHPDYSKYYSVNDNAPVVASSGNTGSGFIGSSEFSGFFAPQSIDYQETVKQPLISIPTATFIPQVQQPQALPYFSPVQNHHLSAPLRDFFEESQQQQQLGQNQQSQQLRSDYVRPGPNYISHQIPISGLLDEVKSASADDVERIPPRPNKPRESSINHEDGYTDVEGEVEKEAKDEKYIVGLLANSKTPVDYNIGKSSSTVSQYPAATGYVKPSPGSLTPYQKYSFQPSTGESAINSKYFESPHSPNYERLTRPAASIESQATENVPSHLKGQDCRKLNRASSKDSEEMNCFVCENAATKSKYTQCSYTSEQEPEEYNSRKSEKYSAPAKEINLRYRRFARNDDPYSLIRERSIKANSEPTIPSGYNAGFNYEPEHYEESHPSLSYSEKQSEELKKDPKNCKKVDRDGMTCTICKNAENGGNYEQCSYTSEPNKKQYAYVTEKKYDSDDPEETKVSPRTEEAEEAEQSEQSSEKPEAETTEDYDGRVEQKSPKKRNEEDSSSYDKKEHDSYYYPYASSRLTEKEAEDDDDKYEIPGHFAESVKNEARRKGSSNDEPHRDFDAYHAQLFPELSQQESKRQQDNSEYYIPAASKQNVEEVLAEFSKKDRSTCKKSEKNGMTCFLCVDKNNIQHEECMYIQESKPQSSHVAYHQLKGTKKLEDAQSQPEETKEKPIVIADSRRKTSFKKANLQDPSLVAAASEGFAMAVPFEESKKHYKKRSLKKYRSTKEESEPTLETPTEAKVGDEEGAYSEETKPVYSKLHGVQLPRYMVDKSEFEKEFDSFSGSM